MVTLGPGPSGLTRIIANKPDREAAIIAARQDELKTNMQATVDGMKALAEANRGSNQSDFPKLGSGGMRRREKESWTVPQRKELPLAGTADPRGHWWKHCFVTLFVLQ